MYKHVVITGGAGFVGSNLVHEMAKRYPEADLTVVDDFRSGSFKNLESFKGDVIAGDLAQLEMKKYFGGRKVDLVFHLASITDTTDHNQFRQMHDNVESWRNLLNYFEGRKTRLVYASSAATYGIAAVHFSQPHTQVVIVGNDDLAAQLYNVAASFFGFDRAVLKLAANEAVSQNLPPALAETIPQIPAIRNGKAVAVVCSNFSCRPPISDPEKLRKDLAGVAKS